MVDLRPRGPRANPPPPFQPPPPPLGPYPGRPAPGRVGVRGRAGQGANQRNATGGRGGGRAPPPGQVVPLGPDQQPLPPVNPFHIVLRRMGLSDAAIQGLANLGLDNVQSFSDVTEKDIPSIIKELRRNNIMVHQTSQNYLQALRYWVMRQERLHVNYVAEDFTDLVMRESLQRYQTSTEVISHEIIKAPEKFKDKNKWRDFCDSFVTFMQRMKGQCDFPLSYVLRENEDHTGINMEDYETIDAYEEAIVPFSGMHYDADNNAVYDSLKSFLLGGPHWTWIQGHERRRDGRSAWLTLKEHFDGPNSQIRLKASTYASICRAEYKGAKNFDIKLYRHIHTQAHLDLARYGEPVPETKKVKDYLDGITDPSLQPVKYTLAGFTHLMENFEEAANYISNIIDLNKKTDFSSRNVSSANTGRGNGKYGGRGRGGKEKGRGVRGGRGRGRGGRTGGRNINNPGRWISSDDWNNMSKEDKEGIRNARSNYAKQKISSVTGKNGDDNDKNDNGDNDTNPPNTTEAY